MRNLRQREFRPSEIIENVIRFRTFSKAYGMAGARVGYAICSAPLAKAFDRIRNHFGMCRISVAGALAALDDEAWLAHIKAEVAASRTRIGQIAEANGLVPLPSATNFVAIDCGRDGGFARTVLAVSLLSAAFSCACRLSRRRIGAFASLAEKPTTWRPLPTRSPRLCAQLEVHNPSPRAAWALGLVLSM